MPDLSDDALSQAIAAAAHDAPYPDGRPGRFLTLDAVAALARECGLSPRRVEIAALERGVCPLRYARNLRAFTMAEQARLLASCAAMVGLGGLGGGLLENLVRTGVGTVRAADGDIFEESNLNRQLLSDRAALGVPKASAALARAAAVNPSVDFSAQAGFLDRAGMDALLEGADVAVDALGGLVDRPALAAAARQRGIPLVTGAVAGYTVIVATVPPGASSPVELLAGGGGTAAEEVLGCPSPAVMAAAALMAAEVVRLLAGRAPALAGKALVADLEAMRFDTVTF
ncbi:ThiF family adenylyltransferase [Solidesulfovibrio sp.]|uniref:HesA/MoeB/ThiF family protein n=1 Tax=Solidesulfovibrio sp. TaxID=2910990 RepID=UPI00263152F3|nr:ThiF family adenylyltransferase [Solidesulfovibrio sp.]